MRRLFTSSIFIAFPLFLLSQNISVKSFRLVDNDLDALVNYPEIDRSNGEKAALIKIITTETGFDFGGGQLGIVKVVYKTAEVWVYVPAKLKAMTIAHPKLGQLPNKYYSFDIPIISGKVYLMELTSGTVETIVKPPEIETQWLIVNTDPTEADIYINDQPAGKTPYQNELPVGKYTWRLSKEMYQTEAGAVELSTKGGKSKIDMKLKSNFGSITITTIPESGAIITLDGISTGKATPCNLDQIPAGEHTIGISSEWYETTSRRITLAVGQSLPIQVEMNPTFAEVNVKTDPPSDIFINSLLKGNGTWIGRLNPGVYTFEAKINNYTPATQKQTVTKGTPLTLNLKPIPKGGLKSV
jgi:hypothetical protein